MEYTYTYCHHICQPKHHFIPNFLLCKNSFQFCHANYRLGSENCSKLRFPQYDRNWRHAYHTCIPERDKASFAFLLWKPLNPRWTEICILTSNLENATGEWLSKLFKCISNNASTMQAQYSLFQFLRVSDNPWIPLTMCLTWKCCLLISHFKPF